VSKNDRWAVVGAAWNDESQDMMKYIEEKTGVEPKFFALYSTMMAFIRHAGLDENHPVAYCNGELMGNMVKLRKKFNEKV
jgi:phenolic acid decarboxylase